MPALRKKGDRTQPEWTSGQPPEATLMGMAKPTALIANSTTIAINFRRARGSMRLCYAPDRSIEVTSLPFARTSIDSSGLQTSTEVKSDHLATAEPFVGPAHSPASGATVPRHLGTRCDLAPRLLKTH